MPETKTALPLALLRCIWRPMAAAAVPRLALILFQYSQPLLIKHSIRYVSTAPASTPTPLGYWLIVSSIVVYIGLAVCPPPYPPPNPLTPPPARSRRLPTPPQPSPPHHQQRPHRPHSLQNHGRPEHPARQRQRRSHHPHEHRRRRPLLHRPDRRRIRRLHRRSPRRLRPARPRGWVDLASTAGVNHRYPPLPSRGMDMSNPCQSAPA